MSDLVSRVTKRSMRKKYRMGRSYDPVKTIDRLLRRDITINDRLGLLTFKISELRGLGELDKALVTIQQYMSLAPVQPEPWMLLASLYRDDLNSPNEAKLVSDIAVGVAKLDGNFVRQALGEKMRTLLAVGETGEANECLRAILKTDVAPDSIDIALEDDFLNHPNAKMLDPDLVREYRLASLGYEQRPSD